MGTMHTESGQVITLTLDGSWQFVNAWTDYLGHRMAEFRDGAGDRIIFEIVDAAAAEAFLEAARAVQ